MNLAATLFCAVTTWLSVQAITVSVDRADVRPVTLPTNHAESMFINGWRPLANGANSNAYDNIGVNVSPSSQLDRSFAPLHPVLGKLQEHMAVSERLKPLPKSSFDFSPASILGSFAVLSAKQRHEGTDPKTLSTEREYSFLVPPPRDALRFELEPSKKAPLRDSEPYVRSSQFIPQTIKADSRTPTYYIKPASFSTAVHPFAQARPFVNQYNVQSQQQQQQQQQQALLPSRQPAKQFDSLKTTNYQQQQQQSNADKANNEHSQQSYDRFQQHQVPPQVVNGNFYNQISHPAHYKQSAFERDPGFLVHESHEVSYVSPSPNFKFRPSYHFENGLQQQEVTARPESNKFSATPAAVVGNNAQQQRPEGFKQDKAQRTNTYYVADFQKTRYTADINEVLPKANQPPVKFNQVSATPLPYVPKVVYVRPELQQQQQYQSSIIPLNINQRPPDVEYETPESVSLKHFNEQQFLLQQQLIQQDRQRLRDQEKRRQQELQRQQQEELLKRQQEIKLLEQKQKEKHRFEQQQRIEHEQRLKQQQQQRQEQQQRLEQQQGLEQQQRLEQQQQQQQHQHQRLEQQQQHQQQQQQQQHQQQRLEQQQQHQQQQQQQQQHLQTSQPDIVKEVNHYNQPYPLPPIDQYKYVHHQQPPQVPSEAPFHPSKEVTPFRQTTVQKFEEVVTPAGTQPTTQEDFQPMIRPYRPQKPSRDQYRRRKPTTIAYETVPTEAPASIVNSETQEGLTDIPIQTTHQPELTTLPVTERVIRTRRPGVPLRRRRPSTSTTTTVEPNVSSQEYEEELIKYNSPESQEFEKKKRVRPNSQENTYDKRPLRKRPNQPVKAYNKEHGDFDTAPRRVTTTQQPFREISATDNYPEQFLKELYSSEQYNPTSQKSVAVDNHQRESTTESVPIEFYETTVASNLEYYEPTHDNRQEHYTQQAENEASSLEHLFTRTEVNYIETTTNNPPPPSTYLTTQTTTTTTTEAPTTTAATTKATISVPKVTHRTRVRYGNATRPRFSIKDYKTRMEYKNRLAQQSTSTEASTVTVGAKIRGHKNQQAPADPNFKEPSNRYKYMTRSSYRTTTSTTPTSQQTDDNGVTTERSSRFTAKKRINSSHYYRSRVTTSMTPNKQDQEHSAAQSTARPENVFSSAIRKRPTLKSRLPGKPAATEMQSVAESGSFATTNQPMPTEASANEIETPKHEDNVSQVDLSDVTMDETTEGKENVEVQQTPAPEITEATSSSYSGVIDSTTPFDLRHEEELFAKASQSVADLTSSASALYDKPGMFKAVSPVGENRVISAHLKIATDEPTLPIEAFFQEFAKKN